MVISTCDSCLELPNFVHLVVHLECCIQAWRPYCRKDIDTLERIQRRASKLIPELSYKKCLKECGLTTLEIRRLRVDSIEVSKISNGYDHVTGSTVL